MFAVPLFHPPTPYLLTATGSSSPLKRDLFLFAPMGELKPTPYVDLTLQSYMHDRHISSSFRMLVLSLVLLVGEKEVFGFFFFLPPNLNPLILHQNTLSSYTTSECPSPAFSFIQHPDFTRSFFLLLFLNPPFFIPILRPSAHIVVTPRLTTATFSCFPPAILFQKLLPNH